MKILLDECVDRRLARDFAGHEVHTVKQMGWTSKQNGELLALAATQFDALVTTDRNLSFQQNLPSFDIAVVILNAQTNRLSDLQPVVPAVLKGAALPEEG